MRPEPNNDIDLLLRQLSRRNGAPVSEIDEQHLDADELNSYVANALPAAARARYTAHLADCSSCRKLVVELSAAHSPIPVQPAAAPVAPSGLKSFLASLFSPLVLRYAVPAVGLMVIAVIGVVVLRQQQGGTPVAKLTDGSQATPAPANVSQQPSTSGYTSSDPNSANTQEAQRQPVFSTEKEVAKVAAPVTKADGPVANQPADASGATAAAEPPPSPKAAAPEAEPARAKVQEEKKAEAAPPTVATDAVKERAAEKDESQKATGAAVTVAPGSVTRRDIAVRKEKSGAETAGAGQDLKRAPRTLQSAEATRDDNAAGETRSVAGRRFRKSGRVWIDTAYDSSKSITTMGRGSEQYRALVADEPSIRTIADQLDGEIIVVWKGNTYRIR